MKELALHILDVAENSLRVKAPEVRVSVVEQWRENRMEITIEDNGEGMDADRVIQAGDPFFTTRRTRRVGMGLPLFKQHAEMAGGTFSLTSQLGKGTITHATFQLDHPDRQPMGDLAGVIILLATGGSTTEVIMNYETPEGQYQFSSAEAKEILEVNKLAGHELGQQLKELLALNIKELKPRA